MELVDFFKWMVAWLFIEVGCKSESSPKDLNVKMPDFSRNVYSPIQK